jgi:hypothetical protein
MRKMKPLLSILLVLLFPACADLIVNPAAGDQNVPDFEAAWQVVDSVYPYLAFKNIDWDSIHVVYRTRAEQARGDEIYQVLNDLLGELRDGHVYYQPAGGVFEIYPFLPPRQRRDRHAYSPFVIRRYFDDELQLSPNGKIEYGILPDNIGYAVLGDFHEDYLSSEFPAVLEYLRNSQGLILDVRHRKGGGYDQVEAVVSRFLTAQLEKPELYLLGNRIDLSPFTPQGPFAYTNPVVVMINGSTFSAGELFTEVMKQLPNVIALGDTTGGGSAGSHEEESQRLPSGKRIHIGTTDLRRYDGLPWEWLGVPPDVRVEQTEADVEAGRDLQLEAAIALLR